MKTTLNRTIVTLLAIVIAVAAPLTGFAREAPEVDYGARAVSDGMVSSDAMDTPSQSMETALITAKNLLSIDDSVYKDFSYSSGYSNYETREGLIWMFSWSDGESKNIYVQVQDDGTLLSYGKYDYRSSYFGFAQITKADAIAKAGEFIRKAKPDTYSYFPNVSDVNISIHDNSFRFVYNARVNGYDFKSAQVSVDIDKFTGEVTGYSTGNMILNNYKYEDASGIISESEAVAAYAEKIGLKLEYRSYYDYNNGNIKIFPVYMFNSGSDRYISATTGDIVEYIYDRGEMPYAYSLDMQSEAAMGSSAGGRAMLTPAELAAIDQVSNFISSEQAIRRLLESMDLADLDISDFTDRYVGLNKDYYNKDSYYYDINLYRQYNRDSSPQDDDILGLYGRVEAVSGRVVSFALDYYMYSQPGEAKYTEEQAAAAVEAFLGKMAPAELAKTKKDVASGDQAVPYNYRGDVSYNYVRYENDIAFRDNGIFATYNIHMGKITRYSLNWYDNVSFPSVRNVLTPLDALTEFVAQNGSSIFYVTSGNGDVSLVYDMASAAFIDPLDGKALGYDGTAGDDNVVVPDYSDVIGHWSESIVMRLLDNGVYLWGGSFEPDKVMTELEFARYLMLIEQYYGYLEPREFFIQQGIDIEADPDKALTRQEAARIVVEYLGFGKLAQQSEWFVYPFSDDVGAQYKGYITICYMLGIIDGSDGVFNATGNITRAHAAAILANLIEYKS